MLRQTCDRTVKIRLLLKLFFGLCLFSPQLSFCQTEKIDSLKRLLVNAKEDTSKVNYLQAIAGEFRYRNIDTSKYFNNEALILSIKLNYRVGVGDAKLRLGALCASSGAFTEGVKSATEALDIYSTLYNEANESDKHRFLGKMSRAYQILGHNNISSGNYAEALSNTLLSLKIKQQLGDKKGIADAEFNIGNIYANQDNYPESLKHYLIALDIAQQLQIHSDIASGYNAVGFAYAQQGKFDEAFKNYSAGLKFAEEMNDKTTAGEIYFNLGIINAKLASYNEAIRYHLNAIRIFEENGIVEQLPLYYNGIATVYMKQNKYIEATRYLHKALNNAKQIKHVRDIKLSYENLSILDSLQGNFKKALEHYKLAIIYRDSLINQENTRKIVQQQMQFDFDKREDSLKQKQSLTQAKVETQKRQKNYYLGGSVLLGLLSLFVYLNFRNQKKINRLMDDAHAKEKAELELQSLRAQLNPHFMFNSLNAIQELILKEENEKSQSYLARFAKLLRMLLENADKPFIPLQREIDFLQLYLSLENLRIPDLQFSIDVDRSVDTEKTMIPNMILQPYIENAIWHGLSHKENDKQLWIRINQTSGITQYEIGDNGVGRKKAAELKSLYRKEHKSKGMELLSKRFKLLAKEYGSNIDTKVIDKQNETGTIVTILVPVATPQ